METTEKWIVRPIKINCRTCKGDKKIDIIIHNDFFGVVPQKLADATPVNGKVNCPDCKGTGYYLANKL